jgi:hypothetical protein
MSKVYVQFSDANETTIISSFGCPQDPASFPNQATIDSDDARYQAFIYPGSPSSSQWAEYQSEAQTALAQSDNTILRCYENAVPVPTAWASYRKALRAIVSAGSGDATKPLPSKPAYPSGT